MAEYDGSHNFVALQTIAEMHSRIDTLNETLQWKQDVDNWVLSSTATGRVLMILWRTESGLYRSGTKRIKEGDDREDYNSSLFATLEQAKTAGKIWMIKQIMSENFRTHYIQ